MAGVFTPRYTGIAGYMHTLPIDLPLNGQKRYTEPIILYRGEGIMKRSFDGFIDGVFVCWVCVAVRVLCGPSALRLHTHCMSDRCKDAAHSCT